MLFGVDKSKFEIGPDVRQLDLTTTEFRLLTLLPHLDQPALEADLRPIQTEQCVNRPSHAVDRQLLCNYVEGLPSDVRQVFSLNPETESGGRSTRME